MLAPPLQCSSIFLVYKKKNFFLTCYTEPHIPDLVLQLNGERHPSHSLLDPSAVGEGSQALLCLTPDLTCCRGGIFGTRGNWFDSSGEDLPTREELAGGDEFYDNRGESALRLNRVGGGASSFPGGMFRCEIPDVNNTLQELFVGLYPPNTGIITFISS